MGKATAVLRENPWFGLGADVALGALFAFLGLFTIGLATQSPEAAIIVAPVIGVGVAIGLGYFKLGWGRGIWARVNALPLWARVLLPLPVGLLLSGFAFVVLALFTYVVAINPALVAGLALVVGFGVAVALFWFGGTVRDVPGHIQGLNSGRRLVGLLAGGVLLGVALDLVALVLTGNVYLFLALVAPLVLAGIIGLGLVSGWSADATAVVRSWGVLPRIGISLFLFLLLTPYAALLIGPLFSNVFLTYVLAAALACIVVVPAGIWARTYRDAWRGFRALGGEHRLMVVFPSFLVGAAVAFLVIAFLSGSFAYATILCVPLGLAVFLLFAQVFGLLREIAPAVRRQRLPLRVAAFTVFVVLVTAYLSFSAALMELRIDLAILVGFGGALVILGGLIAWLRLGAGMGAEFSTYGALGESGVLLLILVATTVISFLVLGLITGQFEVAFGLGLLIAVVITLVIAQLTGLVEGARTVLNELPWWGELLVLALILVVAGAYGALVVGLFVGSVPVALALGAVIGLAALLVAAAFFHVGEDLLTREVHEKRSARATLLVLALLAGFLAGLFASAAVLGVVGYDVFGLPLFFALLCGVMALLAAASWTGSLRAVLAVVATSRDRWKMLGIVALWLALGVLTGLFATTVADIEPLVAIAAGVVAWTPLPLLLTRTLRVDRTPVRATLAMGEKPRTLAGLGWGVLAGIITLVLLLAVIDSPILAFATALGVAYLVALVFALRPRRHKG